MEEKIRNTMEIVFNTSLQGKNINECTPDLISNWDSLSFLTLILALEEDFNISLAPDEIGEMIEGGEPLLNIIKNKVIIH